MRSAECRPAAAADPTVNPYAPEAHAECDDEYLAGDSLLVAPLFAGESSRQVWLPAGAWYDFETGERFEGGRSHRVAPGLESIPVFVREGGIVPLMPSLPHAPRAGEAVPLEVRQYGPAPGTFRLFDDDGETFAYERGGFRWLSLSVTVDAEGMRHGEAHRPEAEWPSAYGEITWRFLG